MARFIKCVLCAAMIGACGRPKDPATMSVCEIAKDFGAYRDKPIAVRGVYCNGLRNDSCPEKCGDGPWPSFIDLTSNDAADWGALAKVTKAVELEAKKGKRFEIWVTAIGRLRTQAHHSPLGPCDTMGSGYFGFGHMGAYPAQLVAERFLDIEVRANPKSPYDYANMYKGAL